MDALAKIGSLHSATPAQVTIAWLLTQGDDVIPIPGSKQIKYTEENWRSAQVKLSGAEVQEISGLCDAIEAELKNDGRYAAASMAAIYANTPKLEDWKKV